MLEVRADSNASRSSCKVLARTARTKHKKEAARQFLIEFSSKNSHKKIGSAGSQGVTCLQTDGAIDSYLYAGAGHLLHATRLSFPRPHGKSFNMTECLPAPDVGAWGRPPQ
jgi:hypothetical protein